MSTYFLEFKPYAELRSIAQSSSAPSSLVLARSGWTSAGLYRTGSETDFYSFASGLSLECQRVGTEINRCLSTRTSTFLLFLTSGGLVVYLLLRRRASGEEVSSNERSPNTNVGTPADGQPPNSDRTRNLPQRWNLSSWLRWIFEGELLDGPSSANFDDIYVQGQYFGPEDEANNTGPERTRFGILDLLAANLASNEEKIASAIAKNKAKNKESKSNCSSKVPVTVSSIPPPAVYVAPCPNCIRGTCKIRKHKQLRKYLEQQKQHHTNLETFYPPDQTSNVRNYSGSSGTSNSSSGNSPLINKCADSYGFVPTSSTTPYNADDENSEAESETSGVDAHYFPYINQTCPVVSLTEFKSQLLRPNSEERLRGDGETRGYGNPSQGTRRKTKNSSSCKTSSNQHQDANIKSIKQSQSSKISKSRVRVPPEGKERLSQTQPISSATSYDIETPNNLSCGNIKCQDSFCSSQTNNTKNTSRCFRENSVDSLAGVSGSMVDLVKGAREIRRMIRETSMDSLCSDFSLSSYSAGVSNLNPEEYDYLQQIDAEKFLSELSSIRTSCDELRDSLTTYSPNKSNMLTESKSDYGFRSLPTEAHSQESESTGKDANYTGDGTSSPDLRNLARKLRQKPTAREKKLWRLSAPLSDIDSPQHLNSSRNLTAEEDSSLEWESPSHGWHDLRHVKYKVALHQSRSQSLAASDCEDNFDNYDAWEWDSEGFGDELGKDGINFELTREHDNWLPDKMLELDLESELGKVSFNGSINNSRRNSYCSTISNSDFEGTDSISRQIRLPPSGRSSVAKGSSPSTGLTPSTSLDKDLLMETFLNSTINPNRSKTISDSTNNHKHNVISSKSKFVPLRKSRSGSSLCNLSASPILQTPIVRNSVYGKEKSTPPSSVSYYSQMRYANTHSTYNSRCSSEESGFQDFDKSFDSGTGTVSNTSSSYHKNSSSNTSNNTLVAGTPLSPVHEAKEPRGNIDSPSPLTSPLEEKLPLGQFHCARRNLKLDLMKDHNSFIVGGNEDSELPDLETVNAM